MPVRSNKWVYLGAFLLLFGIYTHRSIRAIDGSINRHQVIRADAVGYYAWLPAIFSYQDPHFAFLDSSFTKSPIYPENAFIMTVVPVNTGGKMNKYPPGVAISNLPIYMISHAIGLYKGEIQGYERHYQDGWMWGGLLFMGLGMWWFMVLARRKGVSWWKAAMLLALIVFGTNLFHYASVDIGYSHLYTFSWSMLFLLMLDSGKQKDLLLAAFAAGMIVLVRPFNVVLLPVLLLAAQAPMAWVKERLADLRSSAWAMMLFAAMIALYLLSNYWQTGHFMVYSYGAEGFRFDQPHWYRFLFGFEVGAFVYAPLYLLLIVLASIGMWRHRNPLSALALVGAFTAVAWVLSCWSTWTFGCTIGNRPLIDWLAVFALPALLAIRSIRGVPLILLGLVVTTGITYNQILHYQYRIGILNMCEMDEEKYWDVFLRTDPDYKFYTVDGWDYSRTINDSLLWEVEWPDLDLSEEEDYIYWDSLHLTVDPAYSHRLKLEGEGLFEDRRGEQKINVWVSTPNGDYLDYHNKFFKQNIKVANSWEDFRLEFQLPAAQSEVVLHYRIKDNRKVGLRLRNMELRFIRYEGFGN